MPRNETAARGGILALFALTVWLLYLVFKPFLVAIAWALFLTTAFYPVHRKILRFTRGWDWMASLLSTLLVGALIIGPAVYLIGTLVRSVSSFVVELGDQVPQGPPAEETAAPEQTQEQAVPPPGEAASGEPGATAAGEVEDAGTGAGPIEAAIIAGLTEPGDGTAGGAGAAAPPAHSGADQVAETLVKTFPLVEEVEAFLGRFMDTSGLDLEAAVTGAVKRFGTVLLGQVSPFLQNMLWTLAQLLLALIVMVVLFHDGPGYLRAARNYLPLAEADRDAVFQRLHDVTGAVFYGVMLTSAIQGALGGIGWWLAGLPSPITAGIAMFFCALLPAGTILIWGPGVAWLFLQGHPVKAVVLMAWGALVVSTIDNVIKPIFIGGRTQLNTLMVFFGIVGGMIAFGFSGLFIGPLVITLFLSLLEVIRRDWFGTPSPPAPTASSSRP